jgi:transcriptional regulator with XRE-family HTH domain
MEKRNANILPQTKKILVTLGEQIKLARLRRDLSMDVVCQRASISRATLSKIEKGDPTVAIGFYAVALHALGGMDSDLLLVAKDDVYGRTMQDLKMLVRKRASKD